MEDKTMTRYTQPGWLMPPTPHPLSLDSLKQKQAAAG